MGRRRRGQIDELTLRLISRVKVLLAQRGWRYCHLAAKLGIHRTNIYRYMEPERSGYGDWTVGFMGQVAVALGIDWHHLLGDLVETHAGEVSALCANPIGVWDPSNHEAVAVIERFGEHERRAAETIGFFRIPPGPVTHATLSQQIYRNLFAHLDEFGERIVNAYTDITSFYTEEYERTGGHYPGCRDTSLVFSGEFQRLVRGEGEYAGCERLASAWLDELKNRHVRKLGLRLGFVDERRTPPDILFNLMNADSLILVGTTLSVRRLKGTLHLQFSTEGEQFERDQRHLRTLADGYAEFSVNGICKKIEKFERQVDGPRRSFDLA